MTKPEVGNIKMLDLRSEVAESWDELLPAIERVLRSGTFVGGPEVDAFEREVSERIGVTHAVGLNSGTDALVIALEALGIGPGDEVVTTPFSFFATAEAILLVGATPVFGDIDPHTLNLDPDTIPPLLTQRTRAILPVHLFGLPAAMGRIAEIAEEHGLAVIEDAAQAFGARYTGPEAGPLTGRNIGALGTVAAFSFYPTKTLGAYGDAGMLVTDDDDAAEQARRLRSHGSRPNAKYVSDMLGHNSRLDALQAAILRVKLRRLDEATEARRTVAGWYREVLADLHEVDLPPDHPDHVYHQYTLQVPAARREAVAKSLSQTGVANQHFYPLPLSAQPAVGERLGPPKKDAPVATTACDRVISVPVHPALSRPEVERVAATIRTALS